MRLLKVCPVCLGDMTEEGIPGEVRGHCPTCGYRSPAERRPAEPARTQGAGSMTLPQRNWPYASRQPRPGRA